MLSSQLYFNLTYFKEDNILLIISISKHTYWVNLQSADFFFHQNQLFGEKKYFRNTIRVSSRLDPDQARRFVGPDMGPNCLQRLSERDI